jgi:GNAT superfamily N-acetyltransferase
MMTYNPTSYGEWLEAFGLRKEKDLLAFCARRGGPDFERIDRIANAALRRAEATDRPFDLKRFWDDVQVLREIYNRSWEANWGFVPMTDEEFRAQARSFRPIFDPVLCRILERKGEPIGFALALPDVNPAIRACDGRMLPFGFLRFLRAMKRLDRVRVITLGLVPEHRKSGLDAALINRVVEHILAQGYTNSELSWVLEDNVPMVKPLTAIGGPPSKRYRVFTMAL